MGSRLDEEPPSTLAREVLLRVDTTEVIKWLRLVGESKANALWKKYFLPKSGSSFLRRGLSL